MCFGTTEEGQQQGTLDPCSGVSMIITPRERDIGDFSVRRVLPYRKLRMVGPWILFDHMGPADFPAGKGIDVRPTSRNGTSGLLSALPKI